MYLASTTGVYSLNFSPGKIVKNTYIVMGDSNNNKQG